MRSIPGQQQEKKEMVIDSKKNPILFNEKVK
jgi:hypothetical protein